MEEDAFERRLDQALEATFPASDPIAVTARGYQWGYPEQTDSPIPSNYIR